MASSSFNMETVAGLTPIYVSKRVTIPVGSITTVDLSEFVPQGKTIQTIGTVKLDGYPLPYFDNNNNVTFVIRLSGSTLTIVNKTADWNNFTLNVIIYVS